MNSDNLEQPQEPTDWVAAFLRALSGPQEEPTALAILTPEELARIEFLRWRLEKEQVPH